MLGAIIGDIVGSRFEFNNTNDYGVELFDVDCSFTDDTICTIAIADAILKGIPYKDGILRWCKKYPHPKGAYGASFSRWLSSKDHEPYNSFGNGAAMRVSPVGWAFSTLQEVQRQAIETAAISHNHPEGLIGAMSVAQAIWMLSVNKANMQTIDNLAQLYYGYHYEETLPKRNTFDETCQGCVPLALSILKDSDSFEDAIRKAISYGGDSDTVGAIVGSLAEAKWGVPADFKTLAFDFLPDEMQEVVNEFQSRFVQYE